jgi:hypothetical protein
MVGWRPIGRREIGRGMAYLISFATDKFDVSGDSRIEQVSVTRDV